MSGKKNSKTSYTLSRREEGRKHSGNKEAAVKGTGEKRHARRGKKEKSKKSQKRRKKKKKESNFIWGHSPFLN